MTWPELAKFFSELSEQELKQACNEIPGGFRFRLHIQPGAKTSEVSGLHGDALKVRVKAPPVDGKANAELLRFLAELLQVPVARLTLVRGASSRKKIVELR